MAWSTISTIESAAVTFMVKREAKIITEAKTRFRQVTLAFLVELTPNPVQVWFFLKP